MRTKSPLAVGMVDSTSSRRSTSTDGHLVGDQVLKEIANTLSTLLREYDLAGGSAVRNSPCCCRRRGPSMRSASPSACALTSAALSVIAAGSIGERVHVTVSIGVAALDSGSERELSELLAVGGRSPVPGEGRRPGSGADDQHNPRPERLISAPGDCRGGSRPGRRRRPAQRLPARAEPLTVRFAAASDQGRRGYVITASHPLPRLTEHIASTVQIQVVVARVIVDPSESRLTFVRCSGEASWLRSR